MAAATAYGHPVGPSPCSGDTQHQVDFLLHCVLPVALGPILIRSHLSTTWLWYLVITLHELK